MQKTALIGGTAAFYNFLTLTGANITKTSAEEAVRGEEYTSMIFLPEYEKGKDYIEELDLDTLEILAKRKGEGFRVYAENYYGNNCYNSSVFGYETLGGGYAIRKTRRCSPKTACSITSAASVFCRRQTRSIFPPFHGFITTMVWS